VPPVCWQRRRRPITQAIPSPGNPACFWSQGGSILTVPTFVPSTTAPWCSARPAFNAVVTQATCRWTCAILYNIIVGFWQQRLGVKNAAHWITVPGSTTQPATKRLLQHLKVSHVHWPPRQAPCPWLSSRLTAETDRAGPAKCYTWLSSLKNKGTEIILKLLYLLYLNFITLVYSTHDLLRCSYLNPFKFYTRRVVLRALESRVCRLRVLWVVSGSAVPDPEFFSSSKLYCHRVAHGFTNKTNLAIAASNTHYFSIFFPHPNCSPGLYF